MSNVPRLPRAVIFDMDDTMVATELLYHRAWQVTAAKLGYMLDSAILPETVGKRMAECYAIIQKAQGPAFPMAAFTTGWWAIWQELAEAEGIAHKAGLTALLDLLDEHGIPKAVATSSAQKEATYTLAKADLTERFSIVVTGDQIRNGKPAPDIFLVAAERLGVAAVDCLAVEDSEAGVWAAADAGMRTFMVPNLVPPQPATVARAYRVVDSLHDVYDWIKAEWL